MENILFATNGTDVNKHTLNFACYISSATRSKLKGVFLENTLAERAARVKSPMSVAANMSALAGWDTDVCESPLALCEKNISLFKSFCQEKGIRHGVHRDRNIPSIEILKESRFADLIIIDPETSFNDRQQQLPSPFVKKLLHDTECPVILAREYAGPIEEIVFAYDGSAAAVHAIKQFAHLFPAFEDKKVTVAEVETEAENMHEKHQIRELMSMHYSQVSYELLRGKAADSLFSYLLGRRNCILVMGAYSRSYLSTFFRKSTAELVMQMLSLPIFIAHA